VVAVEAGTDSGRGRAAVIAALAAAAFFAGCAPTPPTAIPTSPTAPPAIPVPRPTGPTQRVIKVQEAPSLVNGDTAFVGMLPMISVYGDGTWVKVDHVGDYRDDTGPKPAMAPATRGKLTGETLDLLLIAAREAGMLDGDQVYTSGGGTIDYPATIVTVTAGETTSKTEVYGLATTFTDLPTAIQQGRAHVAGFLDRLHEAFVDSASEPYVAGAIQVLIEPFADSTFAPAQPPVAWPLAESLQAFQARTKGSCPVLTGADAATVLAAAAKATDRTRWTSDGESYTVIVWRLLPGESGCENWWSGP
jgi:hypothetical protein